MNRTRGFTLIEVIIAVTIIGILMAIAIPSYQQHLRKGRRADAAAFLSDVANKQQAYLLDARRYATTFAELNATPPSSLTNFYTMTMAAGAGPPPTFTVTATAIGEQARLDTTTPEGNLSIDEKGNKIRDVGGVNKGW